MKTALSLQLGQRLVLTPQLQQAIRFLQLSTVELVAELRAAIDSNPLLESDDIDAAGDDGFDDGGHPRNGEARSGEDDDVELPESAEESIWIDRRATRVTDHRVRDGDGDPALHRPVPKTLRESLLSQLRLTNLSLRDRAIGEVIIDCIDPTGYLTTPLEEIRGLLGDPQLDTDEIEVMLHHIQNFDPPGVGARNLRECLLLQLAGAGQSPAVQELARRLIAEYLGHLARRDFRQLRKALSVDHEHLQQAIEAVLQLNPRPGELLTSPDPEYVVPDLIVTRGPHRWEVSLNPRACPTVRFNDTYENLLGGAVDEDTRSYLRGRATEARWLIRSLEQRADTLLRVARAIVERQQDYFNKGDQGMQPLVMREIAQALGVHDSTVSRATTGKYLLGPRGVVELKDFFCSAVSHGEGQAVSSISVQSRIRTLIQSESPTRPISDSRIVTLLREEGIDVARRTVAKYREQMNIPASSGRRVIL